VRGYGVELRFTVRGQLVVSRMAREWCVLEPLAAEKLAGFVAPGWVAVPAHWED
jgi:hypothetical protein